MTALVAASSLLAAGAGALVLRAGRRAGAARRAVRGASSCRSPAARSTRPSSTPRSGSPAPRTRCSCLPTCSSSRSSTPRTRRCRSRWRSRCRCSRRSSTPRCAPACPVDARIEKGRTPTHALRRLWEVEHFDRIVAPARPGFTPKELTWMLTHAPAETVVLRPVAGRVAA